MPFYRIAGTMVHIKFAGKPPKPCCGIVTLAGVVSRCRAISAFTCDHELEDGRLCGAWICQDHAFATARNRHLCPIHRAQRARIQPELFE